MSLSFRVWATALCLAFALASPLVTAAPAWTAPQTGLMHFELHASDGYRIAVSARGATIGLDVIHSNRSRHTFVATDYIARAKLSATTIQAGFGNLGSVSMRFRPSGRIAHGAPGHGCSGPDRTTTRFGVFVGSLRFHGEDGYVSTHIHRAKGKVIDPSSLGCAGGVATGLRSARAPKQSKRTYLSAGFRLGTDATYFEAETSRAHKVHYSVYTEEAAGQIAVSHYAAASASPLTFAFDNALSFASITPPPPFSGTGSIQRNADGSRSWTGSLAVSFPGDADVPLTGPQFKTRLTRSW